MLRMDRTCTGCNKELPIESFYANTRYRGGYMPRCKVCVGKRNRETVDEDKHRAYMRDYHQRTSAMRRYGASAEQIAALRDAQNGACAICGNRESRLEIDHEHGTRRLRGLLCGSCNRGLGLFADDADRMRRAIDYLSRPTIDILR